MAQIANVEYFKGYCNYKLGTKYIWNSKEPINLYWVTKAVQKIYNDIHQPKTGCKLHLSTRFNLDESIGLIAVDTTFVNGVIDYLVNFNKICDVDCACPCVNNTTPTENCQHCGTCNYVTCKHCYILDMRHCSGWYCSEPNACIHCWTDGRVGWYLHCRPIVWGNGVITYETQYIRNCNSTTKGGYENCLGDQSWMNEYGNCDSTCGNCALKQP
jgi:hypothetical protein